MGFNKENIIKCFADSGVIIDNTAAERLALYGDYLVSENEKMNLTAICEENEVTVKHFLDCALLLQKVDIPKDARVADVGTGAGFPGVVLKILRPDIDLYLLDSLNKRIDFLKRLCEMLNLDVNAIHTRAEDAGHDNALREGFDIVTARAVARMSVLSEYCLPLAKINGTFAAMKGPAAEEELADAKNAVKVLGGSDANCLAYSLPSGDARSIITIKKISQTPPKYPRLHTKISKKPL